MFISVTNSLLKYILLSNKFYYNMTAIIFFIILFCIKQLIIIMEEDILNYSSTVMSCHGTPCIKGRRNICLMYKYRVYNNLFWIFLIQMEYRLQSMYNHLYLPSILFSLLGSCNFLEWDARTSLSLMRSRTVCIIDPIS